jgi:hypothetical protein
MCRSRNVKVEIFHLFLPLHHYQCNYEFRCNLFTALCHIVCAYYVCVMTAHQLGYLYIYWIVILCGSLLVVTVFVWAKLNVEVCLVVFLVCLVAQRPVRSPVNVSVKEGNFPVL